MEDRYPEADPIEVTIEEAEFKTAAVELASDVIEYTN